MIIFRRLGGLVWRKLISPLYVKLVCGKNIGIGRRLVVYGFPIIEAHRNSRIMLGDRVVLTSLHRYTALGVLRPNIIRTLNSGAIIEIGSDVGLSGVVICATHSIRIADKALIGSGVIICDTDFHEVQSFNRRYAPMPAGEAVSIGENVFLGANSIVLKGVTIGRNSVIGAGSVVSKDIPENMIAAGNPCRVVRRLAVYD